MIPREPGREPGEDEGEGVSRWQDDIPDEWRELVNPDEFDSPTEYLDALKGEVKNHGEDFSREWWNEWRDVFEGESPPGMAAAG